MHLIPGQNFLRVWSPPQLLKLRSPPCSDGGAVSVHAGRRRGRRLQPWAIDQRQKPSACMKALHIYSQSLNGCQNRSGLRSPPSCRPAPGDAAPSAPPSEPGALARPLRPVPRVIARWRPSRPGQLAAAVAAADGAQVAAAGPRSLLARRRQAGPAASLRNTGCFKAQRIGPEVVAELRKARSSAVALVFDEASGYRAIYRAVLIYIKRISVAIPRACREENVGAGARRV